MTPLGKHLDRAVRSLTSEAVSAALADSGLQKEALALDLTSIARQLEAVLLTGDAHLESDPIERSLPQLP